MLEELYGNYCNECSSSVFIIEHHGTYDIVECNFCGRQYRRTTQ